MTDTTTRKATEKDLEESMSWSAYGVRLFDDEDDWGWTILGQPDRRRVLAAISRYTRDEIGAWVDLFDATNGGDLELFAIEPVWITNLRLDQQGDYFDWDRCEEGAPGAIAMLRVTLA